MQGGAGGKGNAKNDLDNFNGQNPLDLRADKRLADFHIRRRGVRSFLWELPGPMSGAAKWVLGGWQANGILISQAGNPFTVVSGQDRSLSGTGAQRPNLAGDPFLDTGRNILTGPGRWNLDFALFHTLNRENLSTPRNMQMGPRLTFQAARLGLIFQMALAGVCQGEVEVPGDGGRDG